MTITLDPILHHISHKIINQMYSYYSSIFSDTCAKFQFFTCIPKTEKKKVLVFWVRFGYKTNLNSVE